LRVNHSEFDGLGGVEKVSYGHNATIGQEVPCWRNSVAFCSRLV